MSTAPSSPVTASEELKKGVAASEARVLDLLKQKFPQAVKETSVEFGDAVAIVAKEALPDVMLFLRDSKETAFNFLMDLSAVDGLDLGLSPRFYTVYHLFSFTHKHRLRIKSFVGEDDLTVPTLVNVWPIANWFEREVWDMFGIRFAGHPDLKRILLYKEFVGHPLRKDYPVDQRQPLIGPQN